MKRGGRLAVFLAAALLCTGCSGTPQNVLPQVDPARCLTVYTSHPEEIYAPLVEEFEDRTGIWVQVVEGKSGELLERVNSPEPEILEGYQGLYPETVLW